jgi:hypothetical protein
MIITITLTILIAIALIVATMKSKPKPNTWWDAEDHAVNWFLNIRKGLLALTDDERRALLQRWKGELPKKSLFRNELKIIENAKWCQLGKKETAFSLLWDNAQKQNKQL